MRLLSKYKHGLITLVYAIIYMIIFGWLEKRDNVPFFIIETPVDKLIPFCEYFIVPYVFWFFYMLIAVLFFIFVNQDRKEYYQLIFSLGLGMTTFLIVSYVFPNGLALRPTVMNDNLFTDAVKVLYRHDTSTNVLPSIHVYNSVIIHMALVKCKMLTKNRLLINASFVLTFFIVLSTVFLKQHSIVDVIAGIALAVFSYFLFYKSAFLNFIDRAKPDLHYQS